MEPQTDVRLPVRQIRDANLAWVRKDAGPHDDDLLKSLRRHGMQLPILLTDELIVADGARRLLRAERLGWREVPVLVTTDWNLVQQYYDKVRKLEAEGLPREPMTWSEIVDLIAGPLDMLYRPRRLERRRASLAANAALRRAGVKVPKNRTGSNKRETDYVAEVADVLNWRRSDLRTVREIYWALGNIEAREAEARKAAHKQGGTAAVDQLPRHAESLRAEAERLENNGGVEEGGLYSLVKKFRWIVAGNDLAEVKTGRARRNVGEPTFTERKARAAADPSATGREMDAQTLSRFTQTLRVLGAEADEYTHIRPSVRIDEARTAAKDIKAAVNQLNRLIRLFKAHADYLEESS